MQAVVKNVLLDGFHALNSVFDGRVGFAELARDAVRFFSEVCSSRRFVVLCCFEVLALCFEALAQCFACRFFLLEEIAEVGAVFCELCAERLRFVVAVEFGKGGSSRVFRLFRFRFFFVQAGIDEALEQGIVRVQLRFGFRAGRLRFFVRVFP